MTFKSTSLTVYKIILSNNSANTELSNINDNVKSIEKKT